jgi:hypothetical protein
MKKVFWLIVAIVVLSFNKVQAVDFNKYSDDAKVIDALSVLQNIGSDDVFDRLDKSSTRIIFYDLSLMSFSYAKHYAVSSTDESGNNYILINEKFRNSPKEAIACLIAHESVHQLSQANLNEEVRATTVEAQTWLRVEAGANANTNDDLVNRENKLAKMYKMSTANQNLIKDSIANNSFYQQQLALN